MIPFIFRYGGRERELRQLDDMPIGILDLNCPGCSMPMVVDTLLSHRLLVGPRAAITVTPEIVCPHRCGFRVAITDGEAVDV